MSLESLKTLFYGDAAQTGGADEAETLDKLVARYYRKIYKLSLFYIGLSHEAEEVTQEIFVKILKKGRSFKGQSSPYTWIHRVAVNTLINYIKRKKLVEFISLDGAPAGQEGFADSPEHGPMRLLEEEERGFKFQLLERCITRLSDREKCALYFYYYDGLKQKEIAEIMGTSLSAVESLIHKATKKLKKCVRE